MSQTKLAVGDPVRIDAGAYEGLEGVIEDVQPECSTVRVHTDEGRAYAFADAVRVIPLPMPKLANKGRAITKK